MLQGPQYHRVWRAQGNQILTPNVGRAIRHERERFGLPQEKFAEHASVHRTYISSVELGTVSVGVEFHESLSPKPSLLFRFSSHFRPTPGLTRTSFCPHLGAIR
jgi:DNA-binding XRE family transcriptional regulator